MVLSVASFGVSAFGQTVPTGRAISVNELLVIAKSFGGFLMVLGSILAGIAVILSGILYLTAGGDSQKVKDAKSMLMGGMIGSLIIFGVGIIIGTVKGFASDPLQFFR